MTKRTWKHLARADGRPLVAASILSADFSRMGDDCAQVLNAGADLLHLDVMDGHFVPNLTMGPDVCKALRRVLPHAFLDVHLMVTNPRAFVEPFAKAGADAISFHIEADDDIALTIKDIRAAQCSVGLVINPPTAVERVLPWVDQADLILVMSVNPGFSGQAFKGEVLSKVRTLRAALAPRQRLQMDGGIGPTTVASCIAAGCDTVVAASAIFGSADYRTAIESLRGQSAKCRFRL